MRMGVGNDESSKVRMARTLIKMSHRDGESEERGWHLGQRES